MLAVPVYGHHVEVAKADSDSAAFGTYYAEFNAQVLPAVDLYVQYTYATDAAEKSDLAKQTEDALVITIEHVASLDVRECFADFQAETLAFLNALVESFAETDPAIAQAGVAYADSLFGALVASVGPTVLACAPPAAV